MYKIVMLGLIAAMLGARADLAYPAAASGEVVYRCDFEGDSAVKGWAIGADPKTRLVPGHQGSQSLMVERPAAEGTGYRSVRTALPLEKLRGTRVRIEAMVKAEDVAKPPKPWNGVKCMLHTVSPAGRAGRSRTTSSARSTGSRCSFVAEVPRRRHRGLARARAWKLTTGRVWFDDVKITVVGGAAATPAARPARPGLQGPRPAAAARRDDRSATSRPSDLRVLGGQWKANHVRWQLIWGGFPHSPADKGDLAAYDAWLESALKQLDELLPVCEEVGLKVLVDLHTPPGGRNDASECRHVPRAAVPGRASSRSGTRSPGATAATRPSGATTWSTSRSRAWWPTGCWTGTRWPRRRPGGPRDRPGARDHRRAGPVGQPGGARLVRAARRARRGLQRPHVHAAPASRTRASTATRRASTIPARSTASSGTRTQLAAALQPVIDFQRDYGVHIYIGEFSAIRWAPGDSACDYLRDVIDIFEEHGWDWAYHAFREWDGWSVEHGPDPKDHARSQDAHRPRATAAVVVREERRERQPRHVEAAGPRN